MRRISQHDLDDSQKAAELAGLRYVEDDEPGIRRVRRGPGFSYHRPDGTLITESNERERLKALAIPPAWSGVWICPDPTGHLQVTGTDDRDRKQYIYHERWREIRDQIKFARLLTFGRSLTRVRQTASGNLQARGLPRRKVLAAVVWLLDRTLLRVGSPEYRRDNETYGLTTLRREHVRVRGTKVRFEFRGKGDRLVRTELDDARMAEVISGLRKLRGPAVFQYSPREGPPRPIGSQDVNERLREIAGPGFSAKDFRTWGATRETAAALVGFPPGAGNGEVDRHVRVAIERAAERLHHTASICRTCYVDPLVIDAFERGSLDEALASPPPPESTTAWLSATERGLLTLLERMEGRREIAISHTPKESP